MVVDVISLVLSDTLVPDWYFLYRCTSRIRLGIHFFGYLSKCVFVNGFRLRCVLLHVRISVFIWFSSSKNLLIFAVCESIYSPSRVCFWVSMQLRFSVSYM